MAKAKKKSVKKAVKRAPKIKLRFRKPFRPKKLKLLGARRTREAMTVTKPRSKDIILVLDFGSQYTQLIARRVRENKVFTKIVPYNISSEDIKKQNPKGLILSG